MSYKKYQTVLGERRTEVLQMNWGGLRDPLSHFPQQYHLPKQIKLLSMS